MTLARVAQTVLSFSLVRVVLALFALLIAVTCRDIVMGALAMTLSLGRHTPQLWLGRSRPPLEITGPVALYSIAAFVAMVALGFLAYTLYCRWVEKRRPSELSTRGALSEVGVGVLIGLVLVLGIVGVLAALGHVTITGSKGWLVVVPAFASAATAACLEELALRGIIFRILERSLGTWVTLLATAALFGLLHAGNGSASLVSTLTIAVSGGLVLGAAYVLTRRLWLAIGLHFAVNAAQGGLLGLVVSGKQTHGLFETEVSGPVALTGGAFGIEASVLMLVLGAALAAGLLYRAARMDRILPAAWTRASTAEGLPAAATK